MANRHRFWKRVFAVASFFLMTILCIVWWEQSYLNMLQANGFSLLNQDTFGGFRIFLWGGAVIDLVFVFAFAAGMSWGWKRLSSATDKERFWKVFLLQQLFF